MESIVTQDEYGNIEYVNEKGVYHREDGPALEYSDGYKAWYINGKRHREDGPAIIFSNGETSYYLNNNYYTKEDWEAEVAKLKLERIKNL